MPRHRARLCVADDVHAHDLPLPLEIPPSAPDSRSREVETGDRYICPAPLRLHAFPSATVSPRYPIIRLDIASAADFCLLHLVSSHSVRSRSRSRSRSTFFFRFFSHLLSLLLFLPAVSGLRARLAIYLLLTPVALLLVFFSRRVRVVGPAPPFLTRAIDRSRGAVVRVPASPASSILLVSYTSRRSRFLSFFVSLFVVILLH